MVIFAVLGLWSSYCSRRASSVPSDSLKRITWMASGSRKRETWTQLHLSCMNHPLLAIFVIGDDTVEDATEKHGVDGRNQLALFRRGLHPISSGRMTISTIYHQLEYSILLIKDCPPTNSTRSDFNHTSIHNVRFTDKVGNMVVNWLIVKMSTGVP